MVLTEAVQATAGHGFDAWTPVISFGVALSSAVAARLIDKFIPDKTGVAPAPSGVDVVMVNDALTRGQQ